MRATKLVLHLLIQLLRKQLASQSHALATIARTTKKAVQRDRVDWLERRSRDIASEARSGRTTLLWKMVKQLSGRRSKGPRAADVLKDRFGLPVSSEAQRAEMVEDMMLDEFQGRGKFVDERVLKENVAIHEKSVEPLPESEVPNKFELSCRLLESITTMRTNKAVGEDLLPVEFWQASGVEAMGVVSQLVQQVL